MYQRIKPREYRPVKPVVRTIEDIMDRAKREVQSQQSKIADLLNTIGCGSK